MWMVFDLHILLSTPEENQVFSWFGAGKLNESVSYFNFTTLWQFLYPPYSVVSPFSLQRVVTTSFLPPRDTVHLQSVIKIPLSRLGSFDFVKLERETSDQNSTLDEWHTSCNEETEILPRWLQSRAM